MKTLTLTEIKETIDLWIMDTTFDIQQDWNDEAELMKIQLQSLIAVKGHLDFIEKSGNQIFSSVISLK